MVTGRLCSGQVPPAHAAWAPHARIALSSLPSLRLQTSTPPASTLPRAAWLVIAAVMLITWFAALDVRVLSGPDEGRYAEIAREMVVTGDYVTPRLNGLKYFEKPPLQYWATAAAYRIFEIDEWTSRLAPAFGGLLAALVVGFTLARIASPLAGAYGAIVMASSVLVVAMGHINTLDSFLTGWLALAMGAFLRAQQAGLACSQVRNWMLLCFAALAAATLTKGPVALLIPGGSLFVYSLVTRDIGPWKRLHLLPGMALFLLLTAPWFILVSRANPEFAHFFFIHEHVERFLTTEHKRAGPLYYFVPIFGLGLMPWLFTWFATFIRSWRDSMRADNGFDWMRFCFVWAVFVFVFFSVSGSKLPSYILPEFPAIAMLLGFELTRISTRTLRITTAMHAVVVIGFLAFMLFFYGPGIAQMASAATPEVMFVNFQKWLTAAGIIFVAGSLTALWCFRRTELAWRTWGIVALSACGLIGFQVAFVGHESFRLVRSSVDIIRMADNLPGGPMDRRAPFYQLGDYEQTFPYYLGRTTTLVNYRDELSLGMDSEPDKTYPTYEAWMPVWAALPRGYALMQNTTYDYMQSLNVPMRVLARDPRRVLVARR